MTRLEHSILIKGDIDEIFNVSCDVERWPDIFPPCKKIEILRKEGNETIFRITAMVKDKIRSWISKRITDNKIVRFIQLEPDSEILSSMQGEWRFEKAEGGTRVVLIHEYELASYDDKEMMEEIKRLVHDACDQNSKKELYAIKEWIEAKGGKDMFSFSDSVEIKGNIDEVYSYFYEVEMWHELLPHCKGIKMIETDGVRQLFEMTILTNGREETMQSERYCKKNHSILYHQPSPPPLIKTHKGAWLFQELPGGAKVIAQHEVEIDKSKISEILGEGCSFEEAKKIIERAIKNNSRTTMMIIKGKIEKDQSVQ